MNARNTSTFLFIVCGINVVAGCDGKRAVNRDPQAEGAIYDTPTASDAEESRAIGEYIERRAKTELRTSPMVFVRPRRTTNTVLVYGVTDKNEWNRITAFAQVAREKLSKKLLIVEFYERREHDSNLDRLLHRAVISDVR